MSSLKTRLIPYRLPLKMRWSSNQGQLFERRGWLIQLSQGGHQGYGDCAPLAQAGTEPLAEAEAWLRQQLPQLKGKTAQQVLAELPPVTEAPPAARCGLETALLDLISRQKGIPLARYLSNKTATTVPVNANIGALDSQSAEQARLALQDGFHLLKLKIGINSIEGDLKWLKRLTDTLPAPIQLRLDANRAWSFEEAHAFLQKITGLPIESLEEPLASPDFNTLPLLQKRSPCALALDESLRGFDMDLVLRNKPIRRLILKPMAQGGLLPSLKLAKLAHAAGMEVVITTMIESSAGVWACCHLAAAINGETKHQAHGLATSSWLSQDLGKPPNITQGRITLPTTAGSGFVPT